MTEEKIIQAIKLMMKKYHWHLDRSLKFRKKLEDRQLSSKEVAVITLKLVDSEQNCIELDGRISKMIHTLQLHPYEKERK